MPNWNQDNRNNVMAAIETVVNHYPTDNYIREKLIDSLLWLLTENNNEGQKKKYFGQQYWSLRAINQTIITGVVKELRHEHVIPKNLLKELLLIDGGFEWVAYQAKSAVITRDEARELDRHYKNTVPEGEIWNGEIDPEFADIQGIWHLLFPEEQNVVGCPRRPFCRYIELRDIHHFTIRLFDLSSLEISNSQIFFDLFADCGNEEDILNRLTNMGCVEAF